MNKILYKICASLGMIALVFSMACSPEEFSLGAKDVTPDDLAENIAFTITHDATNPNIIYLESKMGTGYTPLWNHPQGLSQDNKVTLKMPFSGTYDVTFGVLTRGGAVFGETVQFTIDDIFPGFITHEHWTLLTGGIGKSKTWVLDLFPEEEAPKFAKYFIGPLYFYDMYYYWENITGDEDVIYPDGVSSSEAWGSWPADWTGNGSWLFGGVQDTDYGTMTFDLIDGAHLIVDHKVLGRQETGNFLLDTDNHTLKTTNAFILHDASRDGQVVDWGNIRILSLTENTMQLAVVRDKALSGEDATLLCYNFISKDYSDNWVPGEVEEPEPELPDGWVDDVSKTVNFAVKWVLSPETPFNWANLDGSLKNEWNSVADYPDWTGFNATVPAIYEDFSLTLDATTMEAAYVNPEGATEDGTYLLDEEKGIYTFYGVSPSFTIGSWVQLKTSDENSWRITSIEKDLSGSVTGMWVGYREIDSETGEYKAQYMVYKLIPQVGSESLDPEQVVKNIICGTIWKVDSDRTYDKTTSWGAEQGPVIFSDYSTWAWNPLPGTHYASGEEGVDYGTMKFELDGSVSVNQHRRIYTYVDDDSGETLVRNGSPVEGDVLDVDDVVTLNGTWSLDLDNNKLSMTVGAVHPWTCDYMVIDWGDLTIYRIEDGAMLLQALRDADRSGEGALQMTYVFVPVE